MGDCVKRIAFPFFLFAAMLTVLLTLSWFLLVPELTTVEIGGMPRDIADLKNYKADLMRKVHTLEDRRGSFLQPVHNNLYQRIKALKIQRSGFQTLRTELTSIAKELVPDRSDVVFFSILSFDAEAGTAEVRGDIRNVGPRSMTVLARFVEEVGRIAMVADVQSSRFMRLEHPERGFYSPFTLKLSLR